MPPLETDDLKQFAVIWEQVDYDANGRPTLGSATEISARYEQVLGEVISNNDSSIDNSVEVIVDRALPIGTQVWLGELVDLPTPLSELLEVIGFVSVPDVKSRNFRRVATLIKKLS